MTQGITLAQKEVVWVEAQWMDLEKSEVKVKLGDK